MSAQELEVVTSQQFPPIDDYQFTGDSVTVGNKVRCVEAYRRKATIAHAAASAGIARWTVYRYMDNDPQFAQAMADSLEDAADIMESSVYMKALGPQDPDGMYRNGDSLLKMFWLKAYRPRFRDRMTVDVEALRDEVQERVRQGLSTGQLPAQLPQIPPQSEQIEKE